MPKLTLPAAAALLALGLVCGAAQAQPTRVFVAAQGLDANPCTFAAPCRTLQHAHDTVAAGGEIDVLDPAGYGAVTITKSISIQAHGFAGISVPGGTTGIIINAGLNDYVNLNGLIIEGAGIALNGISFFAGGALMIENCVVRNVTTTAIAFVPSSTSSLTVSNTLVAETGAYGILVQPVSAASITAIFNRVEAYRYGQVGIGVLADLGANSTVRAHAVDSVAAQPRSEAGSIGFLAKANGAGNFARFDVHRSSGFRNEVNMVADGTSAILILSQSQSISSSPYSGTNGGKIFSYGDNYLDGSSGGLSALPRS